MSRQSVASGGRPEEGSEANPVGGIRLRTGRPSIRSEAEPGGYSQVGHLRSFSFSGGGGSYSAHGQDTTGLEVTVPAPVVLFNQRDDEATQSVGCTRRLLPTFSTSVRDNPSTDL
jgi:hypothetical protein